MMMVSPQITDDCWPATGKIMTTKYANDPRNVRSTRWGKVIMMAEAKTPAFFDCSAKKLDGTKVDKIKDLVGDAKAVLVVNVASK